MNEHLIFEGVSLGEYELLFSLRIEFGDYLNIYVSRYGADIHCYGSRNPVKGGLLFITLENAIEKLMEGY